MSTCIGVRTGRIVKTQDFQNRQINYTHDYQIEFREQEGVYWLYGNHHPKNLGSDNVSVCHFYSCCQNICVAKGREPRSMEIAEAIAHYWMLGFSEYVRTSVFPDKGARIDV